MKASTKKNVLIGIASLAGVLLLAAAGLYVYFILQFTVYQDDQYQFSIKYPASWKVMAHPRPNVAVIFLRPKDTVLDTVQENFNVTIQPVKQTQLQALNATIKMQMLAVFGDSIHYVKDKDIHFGWRQGHETIIVAPKPDHLVMVNAWVLRKDSACILTFLGDMNKFKMDSFYVEEMVRSLQLQ